MKKRVLAMLLCVGMLLSGISLNNCWNETPSNLFATAYAAGLTVTNLGNGKVACDVSDIGGFCELYVNGKLVYSGTTAKTINVSAQAGDTIKLMTMNGEVEKIVAPIDAEAPTETPVSPVPTTSPTLSPDEDPPEFRIGPSYYSPALPSEPFTIALKIANEVLPLKSLHVTVSTTDGTILYESNGTSFKSVDLTVDEACVLKVSMEAVDAEGRYAESKDHLLCVCPDHAKPVQVGFVQDDDLKYSIMDHAFHEISGTMQVDTNCANCGYQHTGYINKADSEEHSFIDGNCVCGLEETDFEFSITDGAVKITGYHGSDADAVIPGSIAGFPVTALCEDSFDKISSIETITIPASVSSIEQGAFYCCSGMLNFKLSTESEYFKVEDGVLFSKDGSKLLYYPAGRSGDYSVPKGVTLISRNAFSGCDDLKRIQLPEGLISIENHAICYSTIESIYIPDSVTYIDKWGIHSVSSAIVEVGTDSYAHEWCMENGVDHTTDGTNICACAIPTPTPTPAVTPAPTASLTVQNLGNGKVACTVENIGGFFELYVNGKLVVSGSAAKTVTVSATEGDIIKLYSLEGTCEAIVESTAPTEDPNALDYEYEIVNGTVTITGYLGTDTDVVIPESICGYPVTTVGYQAFRQAANLQSVTIPSKVSNISVSAFHECPELKNFVVASGNQHFKSEDSVLFSADGKTLVSCPRGKSGEYIVPAGVTTIGSSAFQNCNNLTSVVLPTGLVSIESWAFDHCEALEEVVIPDTVTYLEAYAFGYCFSLTDISLPASVSTIESKTFIGSKNLKNIFVANENTHYKSVDGVLFSKDGTSLLYHPMGKDYKEFTIPNGVCTIGHVAFSHSPLSTIILSENVESIGESAFRYCTNLKSINLPKSISSFGNKIFDGVNSNLTATVARYSFAHQYCVQNDIEFVLDVDEEPTVVPTPVLTVKSERPGKVECHLSNTGGYYELWVNDKLDCSGTVTTGYIRVHFLEANAGDTILLKSLNGNVEFEVEVFTGATTVFEYKILDEKVTITGYLGSDPEIVIPESIDGCPVTALNKFITFYTDPLLIQSISIPASVASIDIGLFSDCKNLNEIIVDPQNQHYKTIDGVLFSADGSELISCPAAKSGDYIVPSSVTSIGNRAFSNCKSLSDIALPAGLISIGDSAFSGCKSLNSITLPTGLISIGNYAFSGSLTEIVIPETVTIIGQNTFGSCTSLENIHIAPNNTSYKSIDGVLFSADGKELLCCPMGKKNDTYSVPDGTNRIGSMAFSGTSLEHIILSDGVTTISDFAFNKPLNLTDVQLSKNLVTIEEHAFYGCTNITKIVLHEGITTIGDYAFKHCSSMQSIVLPKSIVSLGKDIFAETCSTLKATVYQGSIAHQYCIENNINFVFATDAEPTVPVTTDKPVTPTPTLAPETTATIAPTLAPTVSPMASLTINNLGDGKVSCTVKNTGGFFELYVNGILKASGTEEKTVTVSAKAGDTIKIMTMNGNAEAVVVSNIEISPEVEVDTGEVPESKAEEAEVIIREIKQELADHVITYEVHEDETEEIQSLTITLESISLTTDSEDSGTTESTAVVPAKLTYNVEPKDENGAKITEFNEPLTFRLPIPSSVTKDYARVYHENLLLGIYEIKGSGNARYVEISSANFSNYSVEPIDFNENASFEITFNSNGGSGEMSAQIFTEGKTQTLKVNSFTRKNFYFTGWNTAADGSGDFYANKAEATFTADTTLYAQWARVPSTTNYTVQYNANGGTGSVYLQAFTSSMTFNLRMNEFVREGYKFVGWNTKADGTGDAYAEGASFSGAIKKSIMLYAQWKLDVPEFPAVRPEYKIEVEGQEGKITRLNDTSIIYDKMYIRWSIGFETSNTTFAMIAMLDVTWVEGQEGIVGTFTIPVIETNSIISGVCYMVTTDDRANELTVGEAAENTYGILIV